MTDATRDPAASLGSGAKFRPIGAYVHAPTHDDLLAEIARLRLTDAEREAVNIAQNLLAGTAHGKSLGSLLERLG